MADYEVYFADSGVAATALTGVTFQTLFAASGLTAATLPTITTASGGWYTYSYAPTERMLGVIDGGGVLTTDSDRYVPVKLTPNDFYLDRSVASGSTFDAASDNVVATGVSSIVAKLPGKAYMSGTDTQNADIVTNVDDNYALIETVQTQTDKLNFTGANVDASVTSTVSATISGEVQADVRKWQGSTAISAVNNITVNGNKGTAQ